MTRLCRSAALVAVCLAAGCTETVPAIAPVPDEPIILAPASGALIEGAYYDVVSIDGRLVPDDGHAAGFRIRGGQLEGSDGCNGLSGPVVQTPTSLRIGPLTGTPGACAAPVTARAGALSRALAEVDGARTGPLGSVALTRAGRDRVIVQQQRP